MLTNFSSPLYVSRSLPRYFASRATSADHRDFFSGILKDHEAQKRAAEGVTTKRKKCPDVVPEGFDFYTCVNHETQPPEEGTVTMEDLGWVDY